MSAGGPPLAMLARPLRASERAAIERRFRAALRSGKTCELPATAFVSLYERGRAIGCVGHRDFASALAAARVDPRFGGARGREITVQLSLLVRGPTIAPAKVPSAITLGDDGLVAIDANGAIRAVLLPDVAADTQRDGDAMLRALVEKARATSEEEIAAVMLVHSERFVARPAVSRKRASRSMIDAAASWLAARIDADGAVAHGLDARSGRVHRTGPFHLGRAAVVIEALAAHDGHRAAVRRARRWLLASIDEGEGLPKTPAERAASLALAVRAGIACRPALLALANDAANEIARVRWHAAQIAVVLAEETPQAIADAALAAITEDAWAPWSVLAADVLGETAPARAGRARLARGIPSSGPHRGGVRTRSAPEVALTALAIEVLAPSKKHRAATARALGFLESQCLSSIDDVPASLDPALALGAFPLAPHADFLRCDVTAHAVLALLSSR